MLMLVNIAFGQVSIDRSNTFVDLKPSKARFGYTGCK